jgi:UDP-N-acetylmuramyl pentapeptide synthase
MEPDRIRLCEDVTHAVEAVHDVARPGDVVLVKASRVARLERIVDALLHAAGPRDARGGPESRVGEAVQ